MPTPRANAFTIRFKGRRRGLYCDVSVRPFTGIGNPDGPTYTCRGVWDTGATNSAIDESLVRKLSLKPISQTRINTANGIRISNVYAVKITIQKRITKIINVTEVNLNGIEMLIGMDVIGDGDFAISTDVKTGDMLLSYRVPSQGKIDFTAQAKQ